MHSVFPQDGKTYKNINDNIHGNIYSHKYMNITMNIIINVLVGFFRPVEILNAKISAKMLQKWRDFNGREIHVIAAQPPLRLHLH